MSTVSVIIPSRNEIYLQKTVNDILTKATGDIELIVILDGYWPTPPLPEDARLKIIHYGASKGMRAAINAGATLAKGKFLMKCDAHCMFAEGFDTVLAADCQENWVVVPRRYALDPEKWEVVDNPKYPIDYMYLSSDLHGIVWDEKNKDGVLKDKLLDETMSNQGSVWFMPRSYFDQLELMDEDAYGTFWNEFQEIGLKCWLSGGRVMVNKKTWYAHWHKTKGRGYGLSGDDQPKAVAAVEKWKKKGWHKQTLPFTWLIEKFWPVPGWPEDRNKTDTIKSRAELAKYFNELGFKKGAEIGVSEGRYSECLCKEIPNLKLFCIDPWDTYRGNQRGGGKATHYSNYELAQKRLSRYGVTFVKKLSMDAVKDFEDGSLDFVFIDGNHDFDYVMQDIIEWSKKVRKGGIVAGHDYFNFRNSGIIEAVDAYVKAHGIKLFVIVPEINKDTPYDERHPCFYWVKQN